MTNNAILHNVGQFYRRPALRNKFSSWRRSGWEYIITNSNSVLVKCKRTVYTIVWGWELYVTFARRHGKWYCGFKQTNWINILISFYFSCVCKYYVYIYDTLSILYLMWFNYSQPNHSVYNAQLNLIKLKAIKTKHSTLCSYELCMKLVVIVYRPINNPS